MIILQPRARAPEKVLLFEPIAEVPLETPADESTLVTNQCGPRCPVVELKSGDNLVRVVFHTQVTGHELLTFLARRGWKVNGRHMVVTDVGPGGQLRTRKIEPDDVGGMRISPTARSVEFMMPAGAKG